MSPALDKGGGANEGHPGVVDGGGLDDGGQSWWIPTPTGCGRGRKEGDQEEAFLKRVVEQA
jgi:hypothetical protein